MMINAEPTAGSTSPVTLAGTLALANAEALSGVVILQLLEPGRPVVFNLGFAHTLDMRRAITRTGAPENGLLGMAGAQLAAFHGLPSASWASTESMIADAQAAAEFGLVALLNALGGVNIIWGVGQLESQRTVSPEQGVICDDIAGAVLRAWRGIGVDAETIAEDVITSIGHSADYLGHDHTLDHFRDELLMPALGFCGRREEWQNAGSQTQTDRARARVREILSLPAPEYLSEDQSAELLSIQESWMKQLAR
jgi:trimethylamine--corrinoid protein Co-methyltransferase